MRLVIYIFISSLWCRGKARRCVPLLNTQCLQNSEVGNGVSSLCLPCGVRNKAFLYFLLLYFVSKYLSSDEKCYFTNILEVTFRYLQLNIQNRRLHDYDVANSKQSELYRHLVSNNCCWRWINNRDLLHVVPFKSLKCSVHPSIYDPSKCYLV